LPTIDPLFQWQTVHLATLYYAAFHGDPSHEFISRAENIILIPQNISKKAVYLQLLEPNDPCSVRNIASAFHVMAIHIIDRAALSHYLVSQGARDSSIAMDFVNSNDARSRREGYIGSALVVLHLGEADILPLPLQIKKLNLPISRIEEWENHV